MKEKLVQSRKLVKEILKGIEKESPDFFRCLVGFMVFESPLVLLRLTPMFTLRFVDGLEGPNFKIF